MASSSPLLTSNLPTLDLPHPHSTPIQIPQPLQNTSADPNDPNPEMLLALIARNKSLEGRFDTSIFFLCFTKLRRNPEQNE